MYNLWVAQSSHHTCVCAHAQTHTHTHEIHQIASRSQIGLWKSKVPPKVCGNPWKILSFSYDLMLYLPLLPFPAST